MRIVGTELFVDTRQVVRVEDVPAAGEVVVRGDGIYGAADAAGDTVEVPVETLAEPGTVIPIEVTAGTGGTATESGELVVAEPGWTVWMVSHFHYDPVWWTTQAAYTATWGAPGQTSNEFRADFQRTGFDLVKLHLETARREPEYKFVLAELDYLKPYWDAHPQDRAYLRRLLDEGRLELVGGTYNEPNTNLTVGRDDDPQPRLRGGLPARRARWRPAHGLAARRVRPRPAVPRARRRCRAGLVVLGPRPVPPVGTDADHLRAGGARVGRPVHDAVPRRVRVALPVRARRADPLHAGPLLVGLAHRLAADPGRRRGQRVPAVPAAEDGRRDPQRAAAGRHRLQPAGQVGHRDPPRLERPVHLAAVDLRAPEGILRGGSRRAVPLEPAGLAADPRHEPDLHRQGRLVHRHQAGPASRRGPARRRRGVRHRRRDHRRPARPRLPARGGRPRLAAARVRRPPRRHHRLRVRSGLPRPAHRLAGGARPGRSGARPVPRGAVRGAADVDWGQPPGRRVQPDRLDPLGRRSGPGRVPDPGDHRGGRR